MDMVHRNTGGGPPATVVFLRGLGFVLTGAPLALMLGTGAWASLASGRPLMDVLLPAELAFLTLPGMILLAAAAVGQKPGRGLTVVSVLLPVVAAVSLAVCQVGALVSGAMPGGGAVRCVPFVGLGVDDLAAVAAPVVAVRCLLAKKP